MLSRASSASHERMTFEIVRYEPKLKSQIFELQRYLWGQDVAVNADYFAWKYERNPYLQTPLIHLALSDGRVVGMRGMYGARWEAGDPGLTFTAPCAGDLVLAPDQRNQGLAAAIIATAVNDLADGEYPYAFNLSAGLATQLGSLASGWRSAGTLAVTRRQLHQHSLWARFRSRAGRIPLARRAANRLKVIWRSTAPVRPRLRSAERDPFALLDRHSPDRSSPVSVARAARPEQMAELLDRIGTDGRVRHVRDAAYVAWRYQNPRRTYRFLFWGESRLDGYLVLQAIRHATTQRVSIVDWEAISAEIRGELLRAAIEWGRFAHLATWAESLPAETQSLLGEHGFTAATRPTSLGRAYRDRAPRSNVLVRSLRRESLDQPRWLVAGRDLLALGDWDLRMIYSDSF
jgi:hypothetical protein